MEKLEELTSNIGVESAFELLLGSNECAILRIKNDSSILNNEIEYVFNDLKMFGLENYKNLKELIFYLDIKSEVAEIIGSKKFSMQIKENFLKDVHLLQFYLPLRDNQKSCYLEATLLKKNGYAYLLLKQNIVEPSKYENLYANSYKDSVSTLFNLNTLKVHLEELIGVHYFGFMDVDNFKKINDTLSHSVGDELIFKIGLALISISDEHVIFYRRSGDEFIFMTNDYGFEETKELIYRIQREIAKIDFYDLDISASLGFTKYEKGIGYDANTAVNAADLGMYRSKVNCKGDAVYISPEEIIEIEKNSSIVEEIELLSKQRNR